MQPISETLGHRQVDRKLTSPALAQATKITFAGPIPAIGYCGFALFGREVMWCVGSSFHLFSFSCLRQRATVVLPLVNET
jgi:hypothetical protein